MNTRNGYSNTGSKVTGLIGATALSLATLGGCSADQNAESQFRAVDDNKASLLYYIGFHIADNETIKPEARGKVLACWYRADLPVAELTAKLSQPTITPQEAYGLFFHAQSKHTRVTKYPSRCEDFPQRAVRVLGTTKNYDAMCKPDYDKEALAKAATPATGTPATGTPATGTPATVVALTGGQSNNGGGQLLGIIGSQLLPDLLRNRAAQRPDDALAQVAGQAALPIAAVFAQHFSSPQETSVAGTPPRQTTGAFLVQIAGAVLLEVGKRELPNLSPFTQGLLEIGRDLVLATGDQVNPGALAQRIGNGAAGEGGFLRLGRVKFTPEAAGNILNALFGRTLSGVATTRPPAVPAVPAAPAAPVVTKTMKPGAAPAGTPSALDEAHPEVDMAKLDAIAAAGKRSVGLSRNVRFAGTVLTRMPECPSAFK